MAIVATLFCQKCGDKIVQFQGARFTICNKCGFRTDFTTNQNVTKYDTVTLRTDEREEVDAMNALIQRWASNGWKIKSLSEFHRTESGTGGLTYMLTRYTTILFEKNV